MLGRELENQHELHKSLLQKETLEHLKLSSAFGNTELREHLPDKPFQVQQLQNKKKQYRSTAWSAQPQEQQQQPTTACSVQLQQNRCHKELENKKLEFTKESFEPVIFKMNSFQLQKLQLSEQHKQQHKAQLEDQIANQQLQQRVAEQQLQQSDADRQLQKNLLQVQEQLQKSNQQPIPLQQLSLEYSNGREQIFDKSFQSSIFGSFVFQINFSASRGLVQKNFPSKQFLKNSLGDAEEGACKEPHNLRQKQLSRRDLQQDSVSDSILTEESLSTATSQTAALRTRPSDRQLQRQQLGRRTLQISSFEKNNFDNSSFKEHSFEDNTFDRSTFGATTFQRSTFEDKSFDKSLVA